MQKHYVNPFTVETVQGLVCIFKIVYNFKGMDRPWIFCMSLSIANKTLCQQSNLTLIHSHNNVLAGAPKGGRKQGSNGLLSCPCQIWERITKFFTSSPSSPMLFSTIHVLEWKSVMKICRWLSSFACRQNKKGYSSWKAASSLWPFVVPYIGLKPFKVSPITLLCRHTT